MELVPPRGSGSVSASYSRYGPTSQCHQGNGEDAPGLPGGAVTFAASQRSTAVSKDATGSPGGVSRSSAFGSNNYTLQQST